MNLKKNVVENINNLKVKYEYKKETHNKEWYRLKMANLETERLTRKVRNMEYKKATAEGKKMKNNRT